MPNSCPLQQTKADSKDLHIEQWRVPHNLHIANKAQLEESNKVFNRIVHSLTPYAYTETGSRSR